ncbi:MAG: recombinase family protein [Bacteroidetes bacterium]|nr:recombinase family protein [Bacteroidota bacterium]
MQTVIYTRVSTDEQRKTGFSLQEQERSLRAFAERMGMEVMAHYQDDYSAKDFNRPQFKRFLQDVETKRFDLQILLYCAN